MNGDDAADLGGTLVFSTSATAASPVGTYAVTPSGLTSANYAFTWTPANLTISKASLTITADDTARPYGDPNPTFSATYGGFVNGDDPGDLDTPASLSTSAGASSPAGTYPITVSGATDTNYDITFFPGTLTIGTAALTVTVIDVARDYGDPNPTFGVNFSGFVNGDDAGDLGGTLSCSTAATSASNVGGYAISCSGYTSGNYAITFVDGTLTVDPVVLTVTPDAQSRDYGAANPPLTVAYGGFVNGDDAGDLAGAPACSTSAVPSSPVGTYPITCLVGTLGATNYTFDLSGTANLTVGPADLTVTVDPATKTYGAANPGFGVTITGFQSGDTITDLAGTLIFTTSAGSGSDVGSYTVSASGLSSSNYAITFADGSLSVTKATLTVTPVDTAIATGDPIPTSFAVDFAGFVAGDDASVVSGSAACSTDAMAGDPAGAYTITCAVGTLAATNYDFVIGGTGVFTIGPVTLTVTVTDVSRAYGASNPAFSVTYSGFVNGDDAGDLGGSLAFATAANAASPVGTYAVTASGLSSSSYLFDYEDGWLTVEPAAQSITFGALGGATFGDDPISLSATSTSGLVVTFTTSGPCSVAGTTLTITGAGTCVVTAHQPGDANHEAAVDVSRSFAVAKATPIVTWPDPADITYGTPLSGTQLNASASVAGTYVYGPAASAVLGAGSHTLTVTFTPTDGGNYEAVTVSVEITVTKADQVITFVAPPDATTDDGPIELEATSSAGLPITYTATGACTVTGSTLTITGPGRCTVTASQPGNANVAVADPVTVSFTVEGTTTPPSTPSASIVLDREATSPGGKVLVTATGFMPGSTVEIWLLAEPGLVATVVADEDGNVSVWITVPTTASDGWLDVEARGVDPDGEVLSLTTPLEVIDIPDTATLADQGPSVFLTVAVGLLALLGGAAWLPADRRRRPLRAR